MVPEKGSGSEGSAAFSGDFKDSVFMRRKLMILAKSTTSLKDISQLQLPRKPSSQEKYCVSREL